MATGQLQRWVTALGPQRTKPAEPYGASRAGRGVARAFVMLFPLYVAAVAAFNRGFAHLGVRIAGLPLFSGEAAIGLFCVLLVLYAVRTRTVVPRLDVPSWLLIGYLAIGSAFFIVGLWRGFGLAAARDFALVYYVAFFFLTLAYLRLGGGAMWLISSLLAWGHGAPGHVALLAWFGVTWAVLMFSARQRLGVRVAAAAVLVLGTAVVYISACRMMLAVAAGSVVALAIFAFWPEGKRTLRGAVVMTAWIAVCSGLVAVHSRLAPGSELPSARWQTAPLPLALATISARWAGTPWVSATQSGAQEILDARSQGLTILPMERRTTTGVHAPPRTKAAERPLTRIEPWASPAIDSVAFRNLAWANALARIRGAPLLGIGFGREAPLYPNRFCETIASPLSNCGAAHNTYFTLAMRMGVPVLIFFLATNLAMVWRSMAAARRNRQPAIVWWLTPLLAVALVGSATYAVTNLFFESPYLSTLYWVLLACLHHVAPGKSASGVHAVSCSEVLEGAQQ
jgi:hypothetical protein